MKKLMILTIIAISILSCTSQKKDLIINLHSENGYGVFCPGDKIIFPNNDSIQYKGIPTELKEYVVRSMPLQSAQYYWDTYKKGKIDKDRFLKIVTRFKIDTTKLANTPYDYYVAILIGTNQKGKRVIIVDSNNDEDFSEEQILEYEYPLSIKEQNKIYNTLPTILTNYEYYLDGNVIEKSIELRPIPYKGSLGIGYNTNNEIEKKYDLLVSFPQYRKGEITIDKTKFEVFASNGFTSPSYSKRETSILFSKTNDKKPSEVDGDIPYQFGDIINLNKQDYLLDNISLWGDTIKLKYIGENTHPTGIREGMFIPKFNAKKLDNSTLNFDQYPNKYILLDFWGTWCNPCIVLIPELKELNNQFRDKKFVLISVAYDRDVQKVSDFVKNEQMEWEHVFVSQTQPDKNSLVEKLKVMSFPTTILISPDGKIIARNKTIPELKEILKNAL